MFVISCSDLTTSCGDVAWQEKGAYEKVGEATETALVVLSEKMNVLSVDRKKLSRKELGTASMNAIHGMWHKDFTLEFSRDRKSMSCYCTPTTMTKLGAEPKLFVKVCSCLCAWSFCTTVVNDQLLHPFNDLFFPDNVGKPAPER